MRADIILRLMCDRALDYAAMSVKWKVDFTAYFAESIARLQEPAEDGLLEFTATGFTVTERGRLFLRNLAMCFDAYLEPAAEGRYSKTV